MRRLSSDVDRRLWVGPGVGGEKMKRAIRYCVWGVWWTCRALWSHFRDHISRAQSEWDVKWRKKKHTNELCVEKRIIINQMAIHHIVISVRVQYSVFPNNGILIRFTSARCGRWYIKHNIKNPRHDGARKKMILFRFMEISKRKNNLRQSKQNQNYTIHSSAFESIDSCWLKDLILVFL